jgi:hypothetical protein
MQIDLPAEKSAFVKSDFVLMACPDEDVSPNSEAESRFVMATLHQPLLRLKIAGMLILAYHTSGTRVVVGTASRPTILIHGEVYGDGPYSAADGVELVERAYDKFNLELMKGLDGSCAIVIIDAATNRIAVITDRANSRRVFHTKMNGASWFATAIDLLPRTRPDPVGVLAFVMSGFVTMGRTTSQDVRQLEPGCVHILTRGGLRCERYWHFAFTSEFAQKDPSLVRSQLAELLHASIRRRVSNDEFVYCSLSGGYDSRAMLGLLRAALGDQSKLRCFSYGPDSSEDVKTARLLSASFGFPLVVGQFRGDLLASLKANAHVGQGMVDFMPSLDVLEELHPWFDESPGALFVGDMSFGWPEDEGVFINSLADVLYRIGGVRQPLVLPGRFFAPDVDGKKLVDDLCADWEVMGKHVPASTGWQDAKDYLYLAERLPNLQLPWREYYAGRFLPVRNAFLDKDILDFVAALPGDMRYDRTLYRQVVIESFPDLFRIPIAAHSGMPLDRQALLARSRSSLESLLTFNSRLDEIVPPENIREMLDAVTRPVEQPSQTYWDKIQRRWRTAGAAVRNVARTSFGIGNSPRNSVAAPFRINARHVERLLLLRCFFADT